ncbi:10406_t:CDS:10 [Acaulospora morrowiae]|uniref:U3 small nucleolar RNA-associated protein 25 n=1 Tax=Acaulospora morrowiae TaxID=94023 RepID=A0A9N8VD83_9GLOM|nr:10406_t:CDS:10 [Acaulospora morrowiae]
MPKGKYRAKGYPRRGKVRNDRKQGNIFGKSRKEKEALEQYGSLNPYDSLEDSLDEGEKGESSKKPYNKLIELLQKDSENQEFFKRRKFEEEGMEYVAVMKANDDSFESLHEDVGDARLDDDNLQTEESDDDELLKNHDAEDNEGGADEYDIHFGDDQSNEIVTRITDVDERRWKISKFEDSVLKSVTKYFLNEESLETSESKEENGSNFDHFKIKEKLVESWKRLHENRTEVFSELQSRLFHHFNKYRDVLFSNRSLENSREIRRVYALHALNHVFKTRHRVLKNNTKITRAHSTGKDIEELRDQGFTRPKVLILLPFRNSALDLVETLINLSGTEQQENRRRFFDSYGILPEQEKIDLNKPADFLETFRGNIDDMFRIGIKFTRRSMKLYAEFYNADIIIASPLGLRMIIGTDGDKKRDFDFLSSIELLIVDQSDTFLMQNWDHLEHILNHLNIIPKSSHDCDFSRVKNWYLDGRAKYFRQNIIISEYLTPEINAIFNKQMMNIAGKLKIKMDYEGSITEVIPEIKQIFIRIECPSLPEADDIRFKYFTEKTLPLLKKSNSELLHTMIFIPSYFDFVRLRNYFKDNDYSFASMNSTIMSQAMRVGSHNSLLRASVAKNTGVLQFVMRKNFRQFSSTAPAQDTASEHQKILNAQRAVRPMSPHLSIYQPQLTWYMSITHRITGAGLATVFYGAAIAYALNSPLGLDFNSQSLTAIVATLPPSVKLTGKFLLAWPFTFHAFNGIRHLVWDLGGALSLKGVYATGYAVLGLSTLTAAGAVAMC